MTTGPKRPYVIDNPFGVAALVAAGLAANLLFEWWMTGFRQPMVVVVKSFLWHTTRTVLIAVVGFGLLRATVSLIWQMVGFIRRLRRSTRGPTARGR